MIKNLRQKTCLYPSCKCNVKIKKIIFKHKNEILLRTPNYLDAWTVDSEHRDLIQGSKNV